MSWRELMGQNNPEPRNAQQDGPPSLHCLRPGMLLEWNSPLFGLCTGIVKTTPAGGHVFIGEHSVTGEECLIKLDWITRRLSDDEREF